MGIKHLSRQTHKISADAVIVVVVAVVVNCHCVYMNVCMLFSGNNNNSGGGFDDKTIVVKAESVSYSGCASTTKNGRENEMKCKREREKYMLVSLRHNNIRHQIRCTFISNRQLLTETLQDFFYAWVRGIRENDWIYDENITSLNKKVSDLHRKKQMFLFSSRISAFYSLFISSFLPKLLMICNLITRTYVECGSFLSVELHRHSGVTHLYTLCSNNGGDSLVFCLVSMSVCL